MKFFVKKIIVFSVFFALVGTLYAPVYSPGVAERIIKNALVEFQKTGTIKDVAQFKQAYQDLHRMSKENYQEDYEEALKSVEKIALKTKPMVLPINLYEVKEKTGTIIPTKIVPGILTGGGVLPQKNTKEEGSKKEPNYPTNNDGIPDLIDEELILKEQLEERQKKLRENEQRLLEAKKQEEERLKKEKEEKMQKEQLEKKRLEEEKKNEQIRLENEKREKELLENQKKELERQKQLLLNQQLEEQEKERQKKELELKKQELEKEERLKKERLEKEQIEREKLEKERLHKLEEERIQNERIEKERIEQKRLEEEKTRKEKLEIERLQKEIKEQELLEKERQEKERQEKEKLEQQGLEKEKMEKERVKNEQLVIEKIREEIKTKKCATKNFIVVHNNRNDKIFVKFFEGSASLFNSQPSIKSISSPFKIDPNKYVSLCVPAKANYLVVKIGKGDFPGEYSYVESQLLREMGCRFHPFDEHYLSKENPKIIEINPLQEKYETTQQEEKSGKLATQLKGSGIEILYKK